MLRGRVGRDLRGLARIVREWGVDLGSSRTTCRRSPDGSLVGSRRGWIQGRLGREAACRCVLRCERRLMGRGGRRRRSLLKTGWCGRHMGLLLLGLRRRWRRQTSTLTPLPRHDCPEHVVSGADGRGLLRGVVMLRRRVHCAGGASATFELPAQHCNLILIPRKKAVSLLCQQLGNLVTR